MFDFSAFIRTLGGSLAGILVLVSGCLTSVAGTGCTSTINGRGERVWGYRSSTEIYRRTEAIPTAPGATATEELEVNQGLLDWWTAKEHVGNATVAPTVEPMPATPMGVTTK